MLPSSMASQLAPAAQTAILNVLANGGALTRRPSGEVSAVRTMTLDGFDQISVGWSPILQAAGYRMELNAVFCHSSPQVTFTPVPHPQRVGGNSPRRCELADLLIVIDHFDNVESVAERRAVLIQAKMLDRGSIRLSGTDWVQHELLGWLPPFRFVSGNYHQRCRNLNTSPAGIPRLSGEYGGIDLRPAPPIWNQQLTQWSSPWLHSTLSLDNFLAGMATGDPWCGREACPGGQDDWSFTVDELLTVTASRSTSNGAVQMLRGNRNILGCISNTSLTPAFGGGGWDDYTERDAREWPDGAISTIHMRFFPIG